MLPASDFEHLIGVRGVRENPPDHWLEDHVGRILQKSESRALELQGSFFEHYFSMSTPGSILRSLIVFEERGGSVFYRRLERIGPPDRICRRHYRYQGVAIMLGDRIFLMDYEYGPTVELTQTVLYPDYSRRVKTLLGVKVGVAAHHQRTPCCARVYLERVPPARGWFGPLRSCGLFPGESNEIPETIKATIRNDTSGPHHFMAHMPD